MRIGIFTDAYIPHTSGVTTSINMLKESLEKMHHQVYIVTANLETNKFVYDEINKIIYIPGIKTGIYETRLTSIYSRKAFKIIKNWNLTIIHSQTEFGIGFFSRIVAKKLKLPIVHTYHTQYEDYVYYVTHGLFNKTSKKIVRKLVEYYCDKTCDELIVPTNKIKNLFQEKYNIKKEINVIPTGIDTKKFKHTQNLQQEVNKLRNTYKLKKEDFVIGAVGRIAKEKSFDKLLYTYKKITEQNSNIKLLIIGDGPELENLKKLTKKINLTPSVIFTGLIDYKLIPAYYHLFNIMTSFSKSETQGLTIIESLASSVPVICVNDTSFKEMVEDGYNGYLFNQEEEFINHITNIINNKELYQELKINAQNSIYKYSKEVFTSDVLKIYSKAINKKGNQH